MAHISEVMPFVWRQMQQMEQAHRMHQMQQMERTRQMQQMQQFAPLAHCPMGGQSLAGQLLNRQSLTGQAIFPAGLGDHPLAQGLLRTRGDQRNRNTVVIGCGFDDSPEWGEETCDN